MLSIVIPTFNAEKSLAPVLGALVPAALDGLVGDVVIADAGSQDATLAIADAAGCAVVHGRRGRGTQLSAGASAARGDWLLFLHADTLLDEGWMREARRFIAAAQTGGREAAVFRFALDAQGIKPRCLERAVAVRCRVFALPYGDQGLLVSRRLYDKLGGFADMPLMEDVDMVRRIGRRRLKLLSTRAITSAARYNGEGYLRRMLRNALCLSLFFAGMAPSRIARIYG